jgi:double-stranded uracil-DNA glycosylase
MVRRRVAPRAGPGVVELSRGFPPVCRANARILILGSLPGQKSLELRQYYAQRQNGFWKIMDVLFGAGPLLPYAARLERLIDERIAVWDVLAAGQRQGSLDSAIVASSAVANDFVGFFDRHRDISLICFNGTKAADLYRRRVLPTLAPRLASIEARVLPSTSPANASWSFAAKLASWSAALDPAARDSLDVGPRVPRRTISCARGVPRRGQ